MTDDIGGLRIEGRIKNPRSVSFAVKQFLHTSKSFVPQLDAIIIPKEEYFEQIEFFLQQPVVGSNADPASDALRERLANLFRSFGLWATEYLFYTRTDLDDEGGGSTELIPDREEAIEMIRHYICNHSRSSPQIPLFTIRVLGGQQTKCGRSIVEICNIIWRRGLTLETKNWRGGLATSGSCEALHVTVDERLRLDAMLGTTDIWTRNLASFRVTAESVSSPALAELMLSVEQNQSSGFRRRSPADGANDGLISDQSDALESVIKPAQGSQDSPSPVNQHPIAAIDDPSSDDSPLRLEELAAKAVYVRGLKRFVIRDERNKVKSSGKDPLTAARNFLENLN